MHNTFTGYGPVGSGGRDRSRSRTPRQRNHRTPSPRRYRTPSPRRYGHNRAGSTQRPNDTRRPLSPTEGRREGISACKISRRNRLVRLWKQCCGTVYLLYGSGSGSSPFYNIRIQIRIRLIYDTKIIFRILNLISVYIVIRLSMLQFL